MNLLNKSSFFIIFIIGVAAFFFRASAIVDISDSSQQYYVQPVGSADDCTQGIRDAITYAINYNDYTISGGGNIYYYISGKLIIPSNITLQNITLDFCKSGLPLVTALVLKGNNITLKNITIKLPQSPYTGWANENTTGAIELVNVNNVLIQNVRILKKNTVSAFEESIGIYCRTKASNVTIRNVQMDQIGWCIFYDDMHYRTFIDEEEQISEEYSGSIGEGLLIENCILGCSDKIIKGDAIEINCPIERFANVTIRNVVVPKTVTTDKFGTQGLGIAVADCDNVIIEGCEVSNVEVVAGAIHAENSTNVKILNNHIHDCTEGIAIGLGGNFGPVFVKNNHVENVYGWVSIETNHDFIQKNHFIDCNSFYNASYCGIKTKGAIQNLVISNNKFIKFNSPNQLAIIHMVPNGTLIPSGIRIINNDFIKAGGTEPYYGIFNAYLGERVFSSHNLFDEYSTATIKIFMDYVNAVGSAFESYDIYEPNSGMGFGKGNASLYSTLGNSSYYWAAAKGTGNAGIYFDAVDGNFSGADYGCLIQKDDKTVELNNFGPNKIKLRTNQQDRLTIAADGKVGIAETSPKEKLHVNGAIILGNRQHAENNTLWIENNILKIKLNDSVYRVNLTSE